ncbi:hypothetical protein WOSG25_200080 [Weissella oryzae SG25]|uniref:Uncharacterized protein n=1 Tax=Weissella oryzae (strain DSM 25784 / JCM 18191 / LMG 30913 / SG25) TaxID=1329250 RepID=A0A069D3G1_WEIOS|nr:TcpD family membrane protein [Weissella oryzae]GAK31926.1 hypothetical protein WOSG25_200080 [Weissella oryzae SG25]
MDLYSGLKPGLITIILLVAAWRVGVFYAKSETKSMWMAIGIAALVVFFVNGPQETMNSFNGIFRLVLNWISTLGG